MTHILFVGTPLPDIILLQVLTDQGYAVTLRQQLPSITAKGGHTDETIAIVSVEDDTLLERCAALCRTSHFRCIVWNRSDDPTLNLAAYTAGASIVLPRLINEAILLHAIETIGYRVGYKVSATVQGSYRRTYERGAPIHLATDAVLTVEAGCVAQSMIGIDGSEVVLGLYGSGQLLVGHPDDTCAIQVYAHAAATVRVEDWATAAANPTFAERLRERVLLMEAWAAMQARPSIDQRVIGMLSLLAEQFGVPHPLGMVVDVRVTHGQLAAAVGATRSTITRILGAFRDRRMVASVGRGEQERFCLLQWESSDHGFPHLRERADRCSRKQTTSVQREV